MALITYDVSMVRGSSRAFKKFGCRFRKARKGDKEVIIELKIFNSIIDLLLEEKYITKDKTGFHADIRYDSDSLYLAFIIPGSDKGYKITIWNKKGKRQGIVIPIGGFLKHAEIIQNFELLDDSNLFYNVYAYSLNKDETGIVIDLANPIEDYESLNEQNELGELDYNSLQNLFVGYDDFHGIARTNSQSEKEDKQDQNDFEIL